MSPPRAQGTNGIYKILSKGSKKIKKNYKEESSLKDCIKSITDARVDD